MKLYNKILIGLAAGVGCGALANIGNIEGLKTVLGLLEPVGTAFIRLITMIVIPLVVASLMVGAASLGDLRKLGRIGGKTLFYYTLTTMAAVSLGLLLSDLVLPGSRVDTSTRDQLAARYEGQAHGTLEIAAKSPPVKDVLLNIIPRNPVQAAANFDLLPLIFFSVVFGAAISLLAPDQRGAMVTFLEGVNNASMIVIGWVMKLAPYAVFALIGSVIAQFGLDLLRSLMIYTLTVILGLAIHTYVTLGLMVRFAGGINPVVFFKRIFPVQVFGFSTSSSNATLPLTMSRAQSELGISKEVSSFVLPLGATINMDGTALYQAVAVMFIAQIYGIPLGFTAQLMVVLTATLASIGTAGVPSAGLITLIVVLQSVGLGDRVEAGIALILGVDRILDMLRTSTNICGDLSCASVIARSEGETLDPALLARPAA